MCDIGDRQYLYILIPIIFYVLSIIAGLMGTISIVLARRGGRLYTSESDRPSAERVKRNVGPTPTAKTKHTFGSCPLYAGDGSTKPSICNYVIGIHSLVCISIAFIMAGVFAFAIYRRRIAQPLSFLSTIPFLIGFVVLHAVSCFLVLVAACVTTAGFDKACDNYKYICHHHDMGEVKTSEAGGWLGFLCWLLLTALFSFRLWHSSRYGEVITVRQHADSSMTSSASVSRRTTTVVVEKSASTMA